MDYEDDDDGEFHSYYLPPPAMGKWESVRYFIWNPDRKEFLGRNGFSWARVTIFYIILYTFLGAFFAGMMHIFLNTLDTNQPKWILEESVLGTSPGLAFRPMDPYSAVISFSPGDPSTWDQYIKSLSDFLEPYEEDSQSGDMYHNCPADDNDSAGSLCSFHISKLGDHCSAGKFFGYDNGKPCVVVKMNKIWGWEPEPYSDDDNLEHLPQEVQELVKDNPKDQHVWITCGGYKNKDKDLTGGVNYYPKQGFPTYYYPYRNHPGYLQPIVAVEFLNQTHGELVKIECKAWAKNIVHLSKEQQGSVYFDLTVN